MGFVAVVTLVLVILQAAAQAQPAVTGLGKDSQGVYFAILEGIGLVVDGAVIEVETDQAVTKLKVVGISDAGVDVVVQEIVEKAKPVAEPPPVVIPVETPKPVYEFRDPFWPVDYDPATM